MIDSAAAAYSAIKAAQDALSGIRMPDWGTNGWAELQAGDRAARAWLAAHPEENRAWRVRECMSKLHYALQEIANEGDSGRRITLQMMGQEAADNLAGEFREWEQAERDRVTDADRARRLREEHDARRLPRRPDAGMVERIAS